MSEPISFLERKQKKCWHRGGIIYDEDEAFAECKTCGEKLTLSFALSQVIKADSQIRRAAARLKLEREEAEKKTRTKCQHCKKITRIRTDVKDVRVLEAVHKEEQR